MKVRVKGGYKIRSHKTGKLWPKRYSAKGVTRRLSQLKRHRKK